MTDAASNPTATPASVQQGALVGWRLLALMYDVWPVVALWMLASFLFTVAYAWVGHEVHQNIQPFSAWAWALWLSCWALTGLYAVISWRKGGQTLGMRPWRLRVVPTAGAATPPSWRALGVRYVLATLSTLLAGAGFWWSWIDRDRLTWHDRASGTRLVRQKRRG